MSMPVDVSELRKEGYVLKESAIIRHYRKRWLVLTRTHLYTFKKDRSYAEPTEVRPTASYASAHEARLGMFIGLEMARCRRLSAPEHRPL